MTNKVFVTKVETDPETGLLCLLFPPEFLKNVNFIEGEFLIWEIENDGVITIRKKV